MEQTQVRYADEWIDILTTTPLDFLVNPIQPQREYVFADNQSFLTARVNACKIANVGWNRPRWEVLLVCAAYYSLAHIMTDDHVKL